MTVKLKKIYSSTLYKANISNNKRAAPAQAERTTTQRGTGSAGWGGDIGVNTLIACCVFGSLTNGVPKYGNLDILATINEFNMTERPKDNWKKLTYSIV